MLLEREARVRDAERSEVVSWAGFGALGGFGGGGDDGEDVDCLRGGGVEVLGEGGEGGEVGVRGGEAFGGWGRVCCFCGFGFGFGCAGCGFVGGVVLLL